MIAAISGKLLHVGVESVVIDVQGVGYEVILGGHAMNRLPEVGASVSLIAYTDVRENAISLFGFETFLEREVFLLLKKVKGVGSRTALGIISGMTPEALLQAIGRGDSSSLQSVQGVGKKTAERLIVELREVVAGLLFTDSVLSSKPKSAGGRKRQKGAISELAGKIEVISSPGAYEDVLLALEKLGFSQDRARTAIDSALRTLGQVDSNLIDPSILLRESLTHV